MALDDMLTADGREDDDEHDALHGSSGGADDTLVENERPAPVASLAVPKRIGRYTVLRRIGAGGMGVVYEAHDEQVDRRVALKLLRGRGGETERLRLLREAQALAQLSHPNVVQVFEVGCLDERAYLVMELVDGVGLDQWLTAAPRSMRRILEVLVQAGQGLAAAHAAGLVHRDFKPANVLVASDGRVRVLDFGLARASTGPLSEEATAAAIASTSTPSLAVPAVWSKDLTHAGAMVGTPAYMSPEQLGTEPVTAASDQFAFCVVLYESLYRQHPFAEHGEVHELLHNILYGQLRPPPATRGVPHRLRAAVLRGLATEPHARWPSMTELLHVLQATLRGGWLRGAWLRGAAAAVVLAATSVGAWAILGDRGPQGAETCTGAEAKLAEVWGPSQRAAMEHAFLATKLPYAAETWQRVAPRLDEYGSAWRSAHAQACDAGRGSAEELDRRMACLERLRGALAGQIEILAQADAAIVEQGVAAVEGLQPPPDCLATGTGMDADGWASPSDPERATRHAALSSELDRVEALGRSGKYPEALALAEQILEGALALDHPPLVARARLGLGQAYEALGSYALAQAQLEQAYFLGQEVEQPRIVRKAAQRLVLVVGVSQQDHERGLEWVRHAEAAIDRNANDGAEADFLSSVGALHRERGEYAEALRAHEEALGLYRATLAPDHLEIANELGSIGVVLRKLGRSEEALQHQEQALAIAEAALGPAHPDIASKLGNLAAAQLRTGHAAQAVTSMQRALAIREAIVGVDPTVIAQTLTSLSVILSEQARHQEAEQAAERAIAILEQAGTQPHTLCAALINLANARHEAGRYEQASASHRRALLACEEAGLEGHLDYAQALFNFGHTLEKLHRLEEADAVLLRAVAILERSGEAVAERTMLVYNLLAKVSLARERFPEAITRIERWLALEPVVEPPPYHGAAARWMLTRACWGAGQRELALGHARDAARRAAELDDGARVQRLRDDVGAWRAEHDPQLTAP